MPISRTFPFDTTEFRLGCFLIPALRHWYERTKDRQPRDKIYWPGFFLCFDIHLHLATYRVSDLPHWPRSLSLLREQPVAQLAIRCPWFCLVLAYRAYDWAEFLTWRSEIVFYYSHMLGWRFEEGDVLFEKEWRRKFSEWFLQEEGVHQWKDMTYRKETKFVRVY